MSFVIGVDIGTGSTKAVLTTLDGTVRAVARRDHAPSLPQPGWAEMDADRDWWGDVADVLAELTSTHPDAAIAAVCVSGIIAVSSIVTQINPQTAVSGNRILADVNPLSASFPRNQ